MQAKTTKLFDYMNQRELALCLRFNRSCQRRVVHRFFTIVSRLGDGMFWYALMALLPFVYGMEGAIAAIHMGLAALICLAIYYWLKPRTMRQRPYLQDEKIHLGIAPLDYYSFPSGHTLQATAFTIVALSYFPELAVLLIPFATAVGMSRVALGLHYPTDVLMGATIGCIVAWVSLMVV